MTQFNTLLKEIGLTRKEFAKEIGITYESMNVMLATSIPKWVKAALIVAKSKNKKDRELLVEFYRSVQGDGFLHSDDCDLHVDLFMNKKEEG